MSKSSKRSKRKQRRKRKKSGRSSTRNSHLKYLNGGSDNGTLTSNSSTFSINFMRRQTHTQSHM